MFSRIRSAPLQKSLNHCLVHLPKQTSCSITTSLSPTLHSCAVSSSSSSSHYVQPNTGINISKYSTLITNQYYILQQKREFSSNNNNTTKPQSGSGTGIRLATLLSKHLGLSRRQAERMILTERVTVFGKIAANPGWELFPSPDPNQDSSTAFKVDGKLVQGVDTTLKLLHVEQQQKKDLLNDDGVDTDSSDGTNKASKKIINEYANTRVWIANKLRGELITEVSFVFIHATPKHIILLFRIHLVLLNRNSHSLSLFVKP